MLTKIDYGTERVNQTKHKLPFGDGEMKDQSLPEAYM